MLKGPANAGSHPHHRAQARRWLHALACLAGTWIATETAGAPAPAEPAQDNPPARPPARTTRPTLAAVRVEQGPAIDGRLDEAVWQLGPAGGPLYQSDKNIGLPMTERTEFRILYDEDHLYIGVWCHDSEPHKINARVMERDGSLFSDDYLYIAIDTFRDRRNGYVFVVNPNGARRDDRVTDNALMSQDWDGIWEARGSIDAEGWKAEIAIPFKTLNFQPGQTTWGFNLARNISRKVERGRWSGALPGLHTYQVSEAGDLTGLAGLRQGLGLEVSPYATARYRRSRGGDSDWTGDFGGDVRYRLTPSLAATLSYNTDFAETEVDQRQLNFTRFPLFFPEQRAFFLEDSGIFEFGGLDAGGRRSGLRRPLLPFFSRRIGLDQAGNIVPILVAGKVAGRVGDYSLGLIDAVLEEQAGLGVRNVFAGRLARNIFDQSTAGVLTTIGDPNSEAGNFLLGPDLKFRTTEFLGDKTLEANLFALGTYTGGDQEEFGHAQGASLSYPNDLVRAHLQYLEVAADFHPALGYVRRRGVRGYASSWSYRPRPASLARIRQFFFTYENEHFTRLDNQLDSARHEFRPLAFQLESGDEFALEIGHSFDHPRQDFTIADGIRIPAGEHWWTDAGCSVEFARRRMVAGHLGVNVGEFYDGHRLASGVGLTVLPWKRLGLGVRYAYNRFDLPGGDGETHLGAARILCNFTPDLSWANLIQYDNVSRTVGYNSRLQWEYRPGSRLFLVLNQNNSTEGRLRVQNTEVALKIGAVLRF